MYSTFILSIIQVVYEYPSCVRRLSLPIWVALDFIVFKLIRIIKIIVVLVLDHCFLQLDRVRVQPGS
jgi:hypothetical protein